MRVQCTFGMNQSDLICFKEKVWMFYSVGFCSCLMVITDDTLYFTHSSLLIVITLQRMPTSNLSHLFMLLEIV